MINTTKNYIFQAKKKGAIQETGIFADHNSSNFNFFSGKKQSFPMNNTMRKKLFRSVVTPLPCSSGYEARKAAVFV
jgi:hypothetical protein